MISQVPPSVPGLIAALESKYKISASNIRYLYRKTRLGVNAKIDDDMLRFYTNEDVFLMQVSEPFGVRNAKLLLSVMRASFYQFEMLHGKMTKGN